MSKYNVWLAFTYKVWRSDEGTYPSTSWVPAYFPRAKHSSFTVDPLATWTNSGNWTSIFGSYSPITPGRGIQMNTIIHAIMGGKSSIFKQEVRLNKCRNFSFSPCKAFHYWLKCFEQEGMLPSPSRNTLWLKRMRQNKKKLNPKSPNCSSGHAAHWATLGEMLWEFMEGLSFHI